MEFAQIKNITPVTELTEKEMKEIQPLDLKKLKDIEVLSCFYRNFAVFRGKLAAILHIQLERYVIGKDGQKIPVDFICDDNSQIRVQYLKKDEANIVPENKVQITSELLLITFKQKIEKITDFWMYDWENEEDQEIPDGFSFDGELEGYFDVLINNKIKIHDEMFYDLTNQRLKHHNVATIEEKHALFHTKV